MADSTLVLVLEPRAGTCAIAADARVAGLSTSLRLALCAQAAGATAIHLSPSIDLDAIARSLADDRLTIRVTRDAIPASASRLVAPANLVAHRGLASALLQSTVGVRAGERDAFMAYFPASISRDAIAIPFDHAPPYGFRPLLVTDAPSASRATSLLLRSLRKPADGWTSTHLNRYLSLAVTRLLVRTSLRPNPLSVAILFIGLASGVVASRGDRASLAIGAALLQTQSVLDGCDGELSRLTHRGSRLGEWLDTIGDDLSNYGFFAGACVGLHRATASPLYVAIGALIVGAGVVASGLEYRYLARIGSGDLLAYPLGLGDSGGAPTSAMGTIAAAIRPLFKRDTFVLLTLVAAIVGLLGPMLAIFAAGAVGVLVAVVKAELRMMRERRAQDVRTSPPRMPS
ncbi:MAG: CDP-alcohol phosphatidyltransferase family protein [Polyangiales bacterium]